MQNEKVKKQKKIYEKDEKSVESNNDTEILELPNKTSNIMFLKTLSAESFDSEGFLSENLDSIEDFRKINAMIDFAESFFKKRPSKNQLLEGKKHRNMRSFFSMQKKKLRSIRHSGIVAG